MRVPNEFEIQNLMKHAYDPVKAREYYLRTRKLKGRKKAAAKPQTNMILKSRQPIRSNSGPKKPSGATKTAQRKALKAQIQNMERKLKKLEDLIRDREREEASEDRKSKAKKERAAKEADKPKTAAEKAEVARENKKYREKNEQKLKTDAKRRDSKESGGSGGSSSDSKSEGEKASVSDLKAVATKVRGQLAVAKRKLAAL